MASISANSGGAVVTFAAEASAVRTGKMVTVTVPWRLSGSAYYGAGSLAGTTVASQTATGNVWVSIDQSGSRVFTYESPGGQVFTYALGVVSQGARGGSQARNGGSVSCEIGPAVSTLTFDPGAGTTPTESKSVTYGEAYGALPTPERSGYLFTGWYSLPEGGALIRPEDTADIWEDTTVYARWEPQSVLHLVRAGETRSVTRIFAVKDGQVRRALGVFSVQNGTVKRGV